MAGTANINVIHDITARTRMMPIRVISSNLSFAPFALLDRFDPVFDILFGINLLSAAFLFRYLVDRFVAYEKSGASKTTAGGKLFASSFKRRSSKLTASCSFVIFCFFITHNS